MFSFKNSLIFVSMLLAVIALNTETKAQNLPQKPRYDGHRIVRVTIESEADMDFIQRITTDIWSHEISPDGQLDFRIAPDDLALLDRSGITYETLIDNLQTLIDAESDRISQYNQGGGDGGGGGGGGGEIIAGDTWYLEYKTYTEISNYLYELAAVNPGIAQVIEVGTSHQDRVIYGIRITGAGGAANKPGLLFNGCQHAREWIAPMSSTYIAEHLITQYGSDPDITSIVDGYEIFVIPIVNVDGYSYTWTNDRMWRKNRRNNGDGSYGVDLNRNWAFEWGGVGSSGITSSDLYRGPYAFSEPETAAVRDLMIDNPNQTMQVDIHSYGQLVLYPWCFTPERPKDYETLNSIAISIADAIFAVHGKIYTPGQWYQDLYPSSGTQIDWVYGARGMVSYNIELRDTGQYGFILPPDQILPTAQELFNGLLTMAMIGFDAAPPLLDTNTLYRGKMAYLRMARCTPGKTVYYVYSLTGEGSTYVPSLNVTFDLANPKLAGSAVAGADGIALLSDKVPGLNHIRSIWLQAAEHSRVSNMLPTQLN